MVAQYLASLFLMNKGVSKIELILDPYLHLTVLSTAFIVSSGFIINSFYDIERDSVNRPNRVIINRLISSHYCLNLYFLFNTIGMVMSFYVSKRIMLFNFLFSIALWLYSHKFRKKAFLGELMAALLTTAPFFSVIVYYRHFTFDMFFYVSFISILILIREILKDIITEKGDLIFDYDTLPIQLGVNNAKRIIGVLMAMTFLPFLFLLYKKGVTPVMGYFFMGELLILFTAYLLYKAQGISDFKRLNNIYKFILLTGILSIPLA